VQLGLIAFAGYLLYQIFRGNDKAREKAGAVVAGGVAAKALGILN
jgi:hypothetical protein